MFTINLPPSTAIDDVENTRIPVRKARPAPATTWKAPMSIQKSSSKTNIEPSLPLPELPPSKFLSLFYI